ncbi:ribbon-helix-helix protein, CopG family [Sphaerochaeta sp. S2]|uniref:type II toxin-antitoxin system RelB family antitoxin n=1 Tax=Sphaerochaeta sp. S2 TaxID=2798868 RepID=UPI0018E92A77|nr:ribbon-helix-helix protein, CopG family [Sphaerochaeta sp. S2]MBJ2356253.1 ribbon-helix-helix protein, CopG family [Sphaerochaeta sp. S2]
MTESISVRLPKELVDRLNNLAEQTGRTKTYYIQEALEDKICDLEMIYLAKKRDEDVRAGRSKTTTLEEVIAENGLSDLI